MPNWMTRRWLIVAVIGALASVFLAACGGRDHDTAAGGSGPWTFTDDRGIEVSLESRPERIIAYEPAASALWYLGVRPVGIFAVSSLAESRLLDGVDLRGIESVGRTYGQVNLEQIAALRPDLIVTLFDPRMVGPVHGFADDSLQAKVEAIAPIVAMDGTKDWAVAMGRFEELAQSLGADLDAPELTVARQRFDGAVEELRATLADKPDLRAVALAPVAGIGIGFARPALFPNLRQYQQWGLKLVEVGGEPGDISKNYTSFFWDRVSFEYAGKYPADLILYDDRPSALDLDAVGKIATWRTLPAVEAGQLVPWRVMETWSYQLSAEDIELLTEAVRSARVVS